MVTRINNSHVYAIPQGNGSLQTKSLIDQLMKINYDSQLADMSGHITNILGKVLRKARKFSIARTSNLILLLGDWIKSPNTPNS